MSFPRLHGPAGQSFLPRVLLGLAILLAGLGGCLADPAMPTTTPVPPTATHIRLAAVTAAPSPTVGAPPPTPTRSSPSGRLSPPTSTARPPQPTPNPPPHVPILAYHLIDVPAGGDYNVSEHEFAQQMAWLSNNGYHSISPAQMVAAINTGAALPPHPVMITFDDNQYTPYKYAVPILKRHGFTAAFFIMTVTIGKDGYMSADQIKDLAAQGFTIGGHTWDHRILPQQTDKELQRQLDLSGDDLTQVLGHPPDYMAYPSGIYDERVVAALQAHGYKGAFRLNMPDDPPVDPAFMIPRQIIAGEWSLPTVVEKIHAMEAPPP